MKRKKIYMVAIVVVALLTMSQKSSAQLFVMGKSKNNRAASNSSWGKLGNVNPNIFPDVTPDDDNSAGNGSWSDFELEDPSAPLGEGIALFALAGLGYAALKRKKGKENADSQTMRKTIILSMAALILLTAQCKKNEQKPDSQDDMVMVPITGNITFGGSKTDITTWGHITPVDDDKIWIYYGGTCRGYMTCSPTAEQQFNCVGEIDEDCLGKECVFMYLGTGSKEADGSTDINDSSTDISFADQTGISVSGNNIAGLDKFHVGSCLAEVSTEGTVVLPMRTKMAIAYFKLTDDNDPSEPITNADITISGLYNTATINKNDGTLTGNTSGNITVRTDAQGCFYIALIPQIGIVEFTFATDEYANATKTFPYDITANHYYSEGGTTSPLVVEMEQLWKASVVTIPVCAIHKNCASSGGVVTGTGVEEQGVCWGTNENPTINDNKYVHQYEYSTGNYTPKNTTTNNTFTGFMSSLADGTTYHVRAYIKKGSLVKYGDDVEFRTKTTAEEPVVTGVDLGLPNGTIWATCNLGAANEYDYGDYYMWGDNAACTGTTSGKCVNCDWQSYRFAANSTYTFTKYCPSGSTAYWYSEAGTPDNKTQLDDADDCVRQTLGGDWRMPTAAEWQELYENTTKVWTKSNGFWGWRFTGTGSNTDKSIFIPAAGYRYGSSYNDANSKGFYWKSSLDSSNPSNALTFAFYEVLTPNMSIVRLNGFTVRPVR